MLTVPKSIVNNTAMLPITEKSTIDVRKAMAVKKEQTPNIITPFAIKAQATADNDISNTNSIKVNRAAAGVRR
jgi:hypothetical protein